MKTKIIGIFVCMLLIMITFLPVSGTIVIGNKVTYNKSNSTSIMINRKTLAAPGDYFRFIRAGRHIRSYRTHIPPCYNKEKPIPLVFILHGHPINSRFYKMYTDMDEKADEEGFIVVYPNGGIERNIGVWGFLLKNRFARRMIMYWFPPRGWNAWNTWNNMNDVDFFRTLIEHLQATLNINSSRIYVAGKSDGGLMTYRLGAELSDILAAIAPIAGSMGGRYNEDHPFYVIPEPEYPLPVIVFHGMKDEVVPYNGGWTEGIIMNTKFYCLSVNESVAFWVEHNQCDIIPQVNVSESGNIIVKTYANGSSGSEVILYSVVNGGHEWFGSESEPCEISINDLMWEFFEKHPKQ